MKENKELLNLIRESKYQLLAEKKVLSKPKTEGPEKPTSGMEKLNSKKLHTDINDKKNKPTPIKTSNATPLKSPDKEDFLTNAAPTKIDEEDVDPDELYQKGFPEGDNNYENFKVQCLGVNLEVKGESLAPINYTYLVGQARKSLEGRGTKVKSIKIEMATPEEIKEEISIRNTIKRIISEEINKK